MVRGINKLSARAAATLSKPGRHSDGGGLYLFISKDGEAIRRRWIFRFTWQGSTKEMGLGGQGIALAKARDKAAEARRLVAAGINPIEAKHEAERTRAGKPTFGQCADALLEAKSSEWRNEKHRAQWRMTLEEYAKPLRALPVDEVDTEAVLGVLQPIWQATAETASRLRGRIETVLDAARAIGHIPRNEANPARWRGHLDKLLPKRQKLKRGHHAAMAYDDVPGFIGKLHEREAIPAFALEFLILTAARSGEVLGATWQEIDFAAKVWAIPATRMKAGREHRVPLSGRALKIVERLAECRTGEFIFPGRRPGKLLSSKSLGMMLNSMKIGAATIHGFRSSFRDWAGEVTHFPRELAEAALAHVIGSAVEQAYRCEDALEKRRALMEAWAGFCEPKAGSNVISFTAPAFDRGFPQFERKEGVEN
jgi:integrase